MSMSIRAFGLSDVGQIRQRNEDTLSVEPAEGIIMVADGMGGAPAGDMASALAVREVSRGLHAHEEMETAVKAANQKILEFAETQPAFEGMGTTVTALRIFPESGEFVIGHVGDSRAYRRTRGSFSQITQDHTLVREMVEAGKLPPEAEKDHPFSHILSRALGTVDQAEVDVIRGVAEAGDVFLLCTDGLLKVMDDEEMEDWVSGVGPSSLEEVVATMVEVSNQRGAPDNVTLALILVEDGSGV